MCWIRVLVRSTDPGGCQGVPTGLAVCAGVRRERLGRSLPFGAGRYVCGPTAGLEAHCGGVLLVPGPLASAELHVVQENRT